MIGVWVGQVALEVRFADHLRQLRARLRMTQKRFRPEDDELSTLVSLCLAKS